MRRRVLILFLGLCLMACNGEAEKKRAARAQANKRITALQTQAKQEAEIERRARALAQQAAEEAQRTAAAERDAAREQSKSRLLAAPAEFFQHSDIQLIDEGFINTYRRPTRLTLLNKSEFPVTGIKARIDFLDRKDEVVATIPVRLKGSIPSGGTETFTDQAGTLSGNKVETSSKKYIFTVTSVSLVEQ